MAKGKSQKENIEINPSLYSQIRQILLDAQNTVARAINLVMVQAYFEIGRLIVEEEQHGEARAGYGEEILETLSRRLKTEFGKGFSVRNLRNMRTFYVTFKNRQTLSAKLSWSHYILLMHQDLGQLQMYVNYYDREIKTKDEERTIGIVLCHDKKETIARYTLPENNTQIFASKYKLYLPTEDELIREVDEVAKRIEGLSDG